MLFGFSWKYRSSSVMLCGAMEGYCDGATASVSRLSDKLIKEENKLQLPPFEILFHFPCFSKHCGVTTHTVMK